MTSGYLAIDQGTTSTKAYAQAGAAPEFVGALIHRQIHPRPGWVEHDPIELLGNVRALIQPAGTSVRVGLANQGETAVAWDAETKRPLANAIVWQDERTRGVTERMRADGLEPEVLARAGLPLDPYFSATKLRWLLDHAEGAAALRRAGRLRLGTSDSFFLDALTGTFATDASTASRTSLLDLRTLCWDPALCDLFGVPIECLAEIRPTVGAFGRLPGGGMIVASVVDQQASLFGHGCRGAGDIKITFGTGGFAMGLTGAAPVMDGDAGLVPTVAWHIGEHAQYALDGGILTAGAALDWLRGVGLLDDFAALDEMPTGSACEKGLFFVPAQAGLGCPYWDRSARGGWIGIGLDTVRDALACAVLEGIALRAAQVVRAFARPTGSPPGRVSVDGGVSRSRYFARFLAAALGQAISVADSADLTAIGLLRLCGADAGVAWRVVEPQSTLPAKLHARFADAVERTRGWTGPG